MKTFGDYRILGRLGRGGMGAVYKAAMPVTGKIVALKVCEPAEMLEDIMGRDEVHRVFLREAVVMARIRHPGIAQVWDVGRVNDVPYFLMEYFCNNLGQVIGEDAVVENPSRPLGPDTALSYARQVTAGLGRLHYEGIVHRDVKPFNVMLTDDNQCRLIDFGLSKLRGDDLKSPRGMAVGSPYYTAPEQEDDPESADARSDLFSVGVTLYRMLTGLLPEGDHAPVSRLVPGLDGEWDRVVERAMHRARGKRFRNVAELLAALDRLAEHWARERDAACAYVDDTEHAQGIDDCAASNGSRILRRDPVKVLRKDARQVLCLDDLWRPKHCVTNTFVVHAPVADENAAPIANAGATTPQQTGTDRDKATPQNEEPGHEETGRVAPGYEEPECVSQGSTLQDERPQGEHALEKYTVRHLEKAFVTADDLITQTDRAAEKAPGDVAGAGDAPATGDKAAAPSDPTQDETTLEESKHVAPAPNEPLVEDRATGLMWQQGGSPYALDLPRARAYVDELNEHAFGGYDDWRLPTVAELSTILRNPAEPGAFCLDNVFAPDRPRLWSADRRSFNSAWYADATLGFVWWQDDTCQFHVRAVRNVE